MLYESIALPAELRRPILEGRMISEYRHSARQLAHLTGSPHSRVFDTALANFTRGGLVCSYLCRQFAEDAGADVDSGTTDAK